MAHEENGESSRIAEIGFFAAIVAAIAAILALLFRRRRDPGDTHGVVPIVHVADVPDNATTISVDVEMVQAQSDVRRYPNATFSATLKIFGINTAGVLTQIADPPIPPHFKIKPKHPYKVKIDEGALRLADELYVEYTLKADDAGAKMSPATATVRH